MDSDTVTGLIGVICGAVLGAGGTWWVTTRLERRRDARRLRGVIGLLAAELKDNGERIRVRRGEGGHKVPREDWSGLLTLGDWDASKAAFSQLMRDESLWERVVRTYGTIFEAISARQDPPEPDKLDALSAELLAEREELSPKTATAKGRKAAAAGF